MHHAALDEGTRLALRTAGDAETLVRVHGTRYAATNRLGDVSPPGACELGFFAEDTRHLSHYELALVGAYLAFLSADEGHAACNQIELIAPTASKTDGAVDDARSFLHVRRLQLVDDQAFREVLEVVNYARRPIAVEIELTFAADFADSCEVRGAKRLRRGTILPADVGESSVELRYHGIDGSTYATRIAFSPAPTSLTCRRATFRCSLEAGGARSIEVCVEARASRRATTSVSTATFADAARIQRDAAERFLADSMHVRCDNAVLQRQLERSALDLHGLSMDLRGDRVLAAGVPWSCCPIGRETLLASYEALSLNPAIAASSLRALAGFQGRGYDAYTEEEPGKILDELRTGEMAACKEIRQIPSYAAVDATPLFVVVAHATYEATADVQLVKDLASAIRAALTWLDRRSIEGTSLVTSGFGDGPRGLRSIALAEVQGYCVDAYRRGAELLAVLGDDEDVVYRDRAEAMARVVDRALWLEEEGRYAIAIDASGQPVQTVTSTLGHLLWSGLPSPKRARRVADSLFAAPSLSPFGIRSLASDEAAYSPLGYHNGAVWPHDNAIIAKGLASYDFMEHACRVFDRIVTAMTYFGDHRLPELFCPISRSGDALVRYPVVCRPHAGAAAAPYLLLQSALGIQVDAPNRRLFVRNAKLPESLRSIAIDRLRIGDSRVSLRIRRSGERCHIDRLDVEGPPIRTLVELA